MYEHILIATDGDDSTVDAVVPGIELASQHGATVHILHVIENDMLRTAFSPRSVRSMATNARAVGERAVADVQELADDYGVESVTWVLRARPTIGRRCVHETIVDYAETNGVDLIVMGATDRGGLSTLLRPSVTHRVMSTTEIPVFGRRLRRDTTYTTGRRFGAGPSRDLDD
jgi:nucleotide-binding universal stress UspA family protein